jgi:hypothetical protein
MKTFGRHKEKLRTKQGIKKYMEREGSGFDTVYNHLIKNNC